MQVEDLQGAGQGVGQMSREHVLHCTAIRAATHAGPCTEAVAEAKQRQLLEAEEADNERTRAKRKADKDKKAAKGRRLADRRAGEAAKKAAEEAERERRRAEKAQARRCCFQP